MDAAVDNDYSQLPPLELYIEIAPGEGWFCHIPTLPGLCFRATNQAEVNRLAAGYIHNYIKWLTDEELTDLNGTVTHMAAPSNSGREESFPLILKETRQGSPVWISGNAAALFSYDLMPLDDPTIHAYLRFTRQVMRCISSIIDQLPAAMRTHKADTEHRSFDEMLTHIGNCVWWYCSRINDELPEPDEPAHEDPLIRIARLLDQAEQYLCSVPVSERNIVHIPARFKTIDPDEPWTHTKASQREAEHMWEHLSELKEAIGKEDKFSTRKLNSLHLPV